ncbi:hypothetical protein LCGC14_0546220 [marine sediment metagenome]|uniref:Uncharacterized protein n=1 Tax=marine sediment metagenome TaxID=412755 RepID=A0A0F9S9U9_9ZZZZ
MVKKSMVRKVFINKKNNQLNVPLSKKQIKKIDPTIKFGEDLFVELVIFNKKKK